jgi:signal transduction histidine kinase/ActR/RegA family two-component response regulator
LSADAASLAPASTAVPHRALARLRAVIVLAVLLPTIGFAGVAAWLYDQEFHDARLQLRSDARIAQEHALKLLETNEMLLQRMLDMLGDASDEALLARSGELHERLKRMAADLPQVQGLFIHGADARSLAMSRIDPPPRNIDYSDREWYIQHRAGKVATYVSEQIVSRATGERAFDMSRRRVFADGRFAGTVHVSLRPEYLTEFYKELATASPGLRVTVLRSDGRMVARWPDTLPPGQTAPPDMPLMKRIASGAAAGDDEGPSALDGVDRLRSFRRLGQHAVYVVAAVDRAAVTAEWLRRCGLLALFVVPTTAGFAGMAWLALRRTREELSALQRLEDETALRQRIEVALLQSQKLEAMGRLTGGVAHDFNNLLMVIHSSLFLHRRLRPDIADSPQLLAIERAVGSGAKLTRQLLAFARKQALLPERIALQDRLPALLDMLKPMLGSSIEIACDVAADAWTIEVDAAELELALINLAVNARDAMRGCGRLAVSARNADAPPGLSGEFVLIEVCDDGPGIDPAIADRVFEPFFTTKPIGQGTGLGLSQVQALCHSVGGAAFIESGPGGGTCVRLFMRRGAPAGEAVRAAPAVAQDLDCRVLLVEDNDAVAEATGQVLEALGCTVQRVTNGSEAIRHVERDATTLDVVLSDIEMPGEIDGIALATRLLQRRPPVPVVLMTGYAARLEQAVRQRLEVLPKPCSPIMLADALAKAMARRAASAEPLFEGSGTT